jgi:hypothetical protein
MWLARMLAAEVEELTGGKLAWVVRELPKQTCPNSVQLEISPALGKAEIVARVLGTTGRVEAGLEDGRTLELFESSVVPVGATVRVKDGTCQLLLADASHLSLSAGTEMVFHRAVRAGRQWNVSLRLLVGELWARITATVAPGTSNWAVTTSNAVVGVRGTEFVVEAGGRVESEDDQPTTSVDVFAGTVALAPLKGKPVLVRQGQRGLVVGAAKPVLGNVLDAPSGLEPISGSHDSPVDFSWRPRREASRYRIQIARDVTFATVLVDREVREGRVTVELVRGTYYWRVLARSEDGRRSFPSQLFKIDVD